MNTRSSTTDRPRFWLQARAWGLISLCLAPSSLAPSSLAQGLPGTPTPGVQQPGALTYQGVLSLIDIGAKPGAVKEAGRASGLTTTLGGETVLPLVELIHMQNLLDCRASKGAGKTVSGAASQSPSTACSRYEWSVPFIPEANARALEQELSQAWNDFDAQSTWYMNSLLNAKPDPGVLGSVTDSLPQKYRSAVLDEMKRLSPSTQGRSLSGNCSANTKLQSDRYINAWNSKNPASNIDTGLFCNDVNKAVSTASLSYTLGVQCPKLPLATDWKEVGRRLTQGYSQAISTYYPQYWKRVYAAIERYMPGSLAWDGVYPLSGAVGKQGGVQLQPVYAAGPQTAQYQELAKKAQARMPGSDFLLVKSLPTTAEVASSQSQNALQSKVPAPAPNAGIGSSWPGIPKLEVLKYNLANREDIFARSDQWWSKAAAPRGGSGAGDLRESERFGAVSFIQLYGQIDKLSSPRNVEYDRWCFVGYTPPIPVLVKLGYPNIASGINSMLGGLTRVHVRYESAPEGYPLHHVKGQPSRNLGTLQAALSARLPSIAGLPNIDALKWPSTETLIKGATQEATKKTVGMMASPRPTTSTQPSTVVPPPAPTAANSDPPPKPTPALKTAQRTKITPSSPTADNFPATGCEKAQGVTDTRMCLARKILNSSRIRLKNDSSTQGGSPRQNIIDAADNQPSARGCGPTIANCGQRTLLSVKLLTRMLNLTASGMYQVTAISGGGHDPDSSHYTGDAIDIGWWAGGPDKKAYSLSSANEGHKLAMAACLAADARPAQTFNAYNKADHQDHVHCDFR